MTNEEAIRQLTTYISQLEENTKLQNEIDELKLELKHIADEMPRMCETCEYEDTIGWEEPCNSCKISNNWKLKGQVKHESN